MTAPIAWNGSADTSSPSASAVDWAFFALGGIAAGWFAVLLLEESLQARNIWFLVVFWAALAYLVLPRIHSVLTSIYIPNYFMGRTRTSDGLFGDPVNLAFLGSRAQLRHTIERAGWTAADPVTLNSSWRIVTATLLHRSYPSAPVSPLLLFNRQQDFAYQQEIDGNPRRRHHLRVWKCPPGWMLPGGIAVDWLAAASYDRRVGLSFFTLQVTHRIGADIDAERDYVVSSLTGSSPQASVNVIKDFSTGYHSRNGGGDSFRTDGDLPVVNVRQVALPPGTPAAATDLQIHRGRPAPTLIGAALVILRALAALAIAAAFLAPETGVWQQVLPLEEKPDLGNGNIAVGVLVVLFAAVEAALALLILRGSNTARITAMSLAVLAIVAQISALLSGGDAVPLRTNQAGYSLDVLLILALSSGGARQYARRHRTTGPGRIFGGQGLSRRRLPRGL